MSEELTNQEADNLDRLLVAMNNHGSAEGSDVQLGDVEEMLRKAYEYMTHAQRKAFMADEDVVELIVREGEG